MQSNHHVKKIKADYVLSMMIGTLRFDTEMYYYDTEMYYYDDMRSKSLSLKSPPDLQYGFLTGRSVVLWYGKVP